MQEIKRPPILLTSSVIAYASGIKLIDSELRIKYALESLEKWLQISPESHFVLCDGSNYNFSSLVREKFPDSKIECLFFENNQIAVKKHGRGYGEGEIVNYAIEHSKYIKKANCFAKCTSKLWVENYAEILKYWNYRAAFKAVFKNEFILIKNTIFDYVDTRFYICNLDFYKIYFRLSHSAKLSGLKVNLETNFKSIILVNNITKTFLPIYPKIYGVGGGTGVHYDIQWHRVIKENLKIKISKIKFNKYYII